MAEDLPQTRRRYIDMWALPGIHPSNIEFMQKLKTADTNHFTTHMDVVGTVSEQDAKSGDWEETHLIGLRTDAWKVDREEFEDALDVVHKRRRQKLKQQIKKHGRLSAKEQEKLQEKIEQDSVMNMQSDQIEQRRLVLKLFKTSTERVRWCGTIEQVTTTEVHNSIGSSRSLLTMAVVLPRTEMLTFIQQNHRTFRIPSLFTCGFYESERMWSLAFKRHWLSIGADFEIEADGQSIGDIDGRLISFGSDSYINLDEHPLTDTTRFVDMITLFAASSGYHQAMRKSVSRRVQATLAGESHRNLVEDEELRLHHNGRAAA